jgi:threonine dehydrogenase-like Zn-dependent dehydrogenase
MRALTWHGRRDVRLDRVPDPTIVNPHDAIVQVAAASICGSDLHLYNGLVPGMHPGDIIGHELVGEIVEVGPACERVAVGDRVAVTCAIACGRCWFCKHELYAACDNANPGTEIDHGHAGGAVFGFGDYAGGQAELVRVPFADVGCTHVPAELGDEHVLFLTDAFPAGWMAAENCEIERGDTVCVFGAGPIGQFALRSALLQGAERVIAVDSVPARLAMAGEGGAIEVDETHGDLLARLVDLTGGRGPDACIDAVGMEAHGSTYDRVKQALRITTDRTTALRTTIRACRKAGRVSIAGVYGGVVDRFPIGEAFSKGLQIRLGQTHYHRYTRRLLDRIVTREIDPTFVVTHRIRFDELPVAYKLFDAKADGCVKVVARP